MGGITLNTVHDLTVGVEIANFLLVYFYFKFFKITVPWLKLRKNSSQFVIGTIDTNYKIQTKVSDLIEISYMEAKRLVIQRNNAVEKVAQIILANPGEMINGDIMLETILSEPLADVDPQIESQLANIRISQKSDKKNKICKEREKAIFTAVREVSHILSGELKNFFTRHEQNLSSSSDLNMTPRSNTKDSKRMRAANEFATLERSNFPPPPAIPKFMGPDLEDWVHSIKDNV